jgi:hypothetical protein
MNQDSQIFTDNHASLNDQYITTEMSEIPENVIAPTPPPVEEKKSLNYAHPRFTMSTFQLYETKTVCHVLHNRLKY